MEAASMGSSVTELIKKIHKKQRCTFKQFLKLDEMLGANLIGKVKIKLEEKDFPNRRTRRWHCI